MLTRLRVDGFKNLVGVDVRFGPFTCIAGPNGAGKSNLFDAIKFLSALADKTFIDAALSVRDESGRTGDVRSLFHRVGDKYTDQISFDIEMIVPGQGFDDLGQLAVATTTFLSYSLTLAYRPGDSFRSLGNLELIKEELSHIKLGEAYKHLLFDYKASSWRRSAVKGERRVPYYISTEGEGDKRTIKLHQDGGSSGRPLSRLAVNLPRTVLSAANAAESPTALLARREMQSWRLLQLEPSSLRMPDPFTAPKELGEDGSHLASTLYHLAHPDREPSGEGVAGRVYSQVANRLSELIQDIDAVRVDRDEQRELLTLYVKDRSGTTHPARALSDGTLRFLALAVLELNPDAEGMLCLEEPENGIPPERIPAMLRLLQDIAMDVNEPVGPENPLRQVIINTHSPVVVGQVPASSLLVAELKASERQGQRFNRVVFSCLPNTWRTKSEQSSVVPLGKLLAYLNPNSLQEPVKNGYRQLRPQRHAERVIDRADLQLLLPFAEIV